MKSKRPGTIDILNATHRALNESQSLLDRMHLWNEQGRAYNDSARSTINEMRDTLRGLPEQLHSIYPIAAPPIIPPPEINEDPATALTPYAPTLPD